MTKKTIRTWAMMGISALLLISVAGCGNFPVATPGGEALNGGGLNGPAPVNTYWLYSVAFPTATNGFAVGDYGTILATQNGGQTWAAYKWSQPTLMQDLRHVAFADNGKNGIAVGNFGEIVNTTNGGATWNIVALGSKPGDPAGTTDLNSVAFVPGTTTAYVTGDDGLILKSTDGGATWSQPQVSGTSLNLRGVSFKDANNGVAVGDYGIILYTKNGGATWNTTWTPKTASWLKAVAWAPGSNTIYAAGSAPWRSNGVASVPGTDSLVFKSTDGGATWTAQDSGQSSTILGIYAKNANTAAFVDDAGEVRVTTDGRTWNPVFTAGAGSNYWLEAITEAPGGYLWAVGTPDTAGAGSVHRNILTIVRSKTPATAGLNATWYQYPSNATPRQVGLVNTRINAVSGGRLMSVHTNSTKRGLDQGVNYAPNYITGK